MLPEMLPRRPLAPPAVAEEENGCADGAAGGRSRGRGGQKDLGTGENRCAAAEGGPDVFNDADWAAADRSKQLEQASQWTEEQFKAIGLANAHREPWTIANGWKRGPATGRVVTPAVHELTLATVGWSTSTNGTVSGEVVGIDVVAPEDLEKYKGKLGGKIVVLGRPKDVEAPGDPMLTPWGEDVVPLMQAKDHQPVSWGARAKIYAAALKMMGEEKSLALVTPSDKTFGLMNMTTLSREYKAGAVPAAIAARDDVVQIWRLLDAGGTVQVELNLQGTLSGAPVEVYNTVAEIRGTEKPDEVVIIGAHLDSWDLGTGATDNGTGSMAVLEAARALQKSGVKPKRTIRFVLFAGRRAGD